MNAMVVVGTVAAVAAFLVSALEVWRRSTDARRRGLVISIVGGSVVTNDRVTVRLRVRAVGPVPLYEARLAAWGPAVLRADESDPRGVFGPDSGWIEGEVSWLPAKASEVALGLVWTDVGSSRRSIERAERVRLAGFRYERWVWHPWVVRLARWRWTGRWVLAGKGRWPRWRGAADVPGVVSSLPMPVDLSPEV